MHTIGEVARLAGVTVRTLHHYDAIALVQPGGRSPAGYRLYGQHDLERLQAVLFYRELGFPLEQIRELMASPGFDRRAVLREQRRLLEARAAHLQRMIHALDAALDAHEKGITMSEEAMFEVFGEQQRGWQAEAEERWGETDAWAESRRRTADYTAADWAELKAESEAIMERIAAVYRSGAAPASREAMDAVEAHRLQISRRFYDCSREMQVQLAEMTGADPRFVATYELAAEGLAGWVHDAILANANRAG